MTNEKPEAEVISIFKKKDEKLKEGQTQSEVDSEEYFRKLEEANRVKKDKLAKERFEKNKKVTKDFNLK